MTVKTSISFTDRHHQFADKKASEGIFTSVSSVVAAGIELIMKEEAEREVALEAMSDTIRHRMETPRSEWLEVTDNESMFTKARARLQSSQP